MTDLWPSPRKASSFPSSGASNSNWILSGLPSGSYGMGILAPFIFICFISLAFYTGLSWQPDAPPCSECVCADAGFNSSSGSPNFINEAAAVSIIPSNNAASSADQPRQDETRTGKKGTDIEDQANWNLKASEALPDSAPAPVLPPVPALLKEAVDRVMDANRTIILVTVSAPFLSFLENWFMVVQQFGRAKQVLVISEDVQAHEFVMERWPLQAIRGSEILPQLSLQGIQVETTFSTKYFKAFMSRRPAYWLAILSLNVSIFFNDLDVVWLQDPLPFFSVGDFDLLGQNDDDKNCPLALSEDDTPTKLKPGNLICLGQAMFHPTKRTVDLLSHFLKVLTEAEGQIFDQQAFNHVLRDEIKMNDLRAAVLPDRRLPSGCIMFHESRCRRSCSIDLQLPNWKEIVLSVHANYMVGVEAKVRALERHGLWRLSLNKSTHATNEVKDAGATSAAEGQMLNPVGEKDSVSTQAPPPAPSANLPPVPAVLKEAVDRVLDANRTIILITVSAPFLDFLDNWFAAATWFGRARQVLIISEDAKAHQYVMDRWPLQVVKGSDVLPELSLDGIQVTSSFSTKYFKAFMSRRSAYWLTILSLNVSILFSDLDVAWLHDPLPFFSGDFELVGQNDKQKSCPVPLLEEDAPKPLEDGDLICLGQVMFHPTEHVKQLIARFLEVTEKANGQLFDQKAFNDVLTEKMKADGLRAAVLPDVRFPSGCIMFQDSACHLKCSVESQLPNWKDTVLSIHANYMVGHEAKKTALKRHGLWKIPDKA